MRKLAILVLAVALAALALVSGAAADPPTTEPLPFSDFTLSGSCSFDVNIHILANNSTLTSFSDGSQLVTGLLRVRLTNSSDSSKTIDLNIPGPGLTTTAPDGTTTTDTRGPWLIIDTGRLLYITGHSVQTFAPDGTFTLTQQGGTSTDLCAVLG
jgi:hypothetical protein